MHKATLQVGQELNARAECWREQGEPLQQGQRAPRVPAELQPDFGKPLTSAPAGCLPFLSKTAGRKHLRFLFKQRSREWCEADLAAGWWCWVSVPSRSVPSSPRALAALLPADPAGWGAITRHWQGFRRLFPGRTETKAGPDTQLKALLSISRAFAKLNSAKTSEPDVQDSYSHWDERLQSLNTHQKTDPLPATVEAGAVFNLLGCICILQGMGHRIQSFLQAKPRFSPRHIKEDRGFCCVKVVPWGHQEV